MFRFLLLLLGTLTAGSPARRDAAGSSADGSYGMTGPGAVRTDPYGPASGTAWPGSTAPLPPWPVPADSHGGPASL